MMKNKSIAAWFLLAWVVLSIIIAPASLKAGTKTDLEDARLSLFEAIALEDDSLVKADVEPYFPYAVYDINAYDASADDEKYYTEASFQALIMDLNNIVYDSNTGIEAINAAVDSLVITENEIDGLIETVDALIGGLVTQDAYTATKALFDDAKNLDGSPYTPISVGSFEDRLDAIEAEMEDPRIGTDRMIALRGEISDVYDRLTEKADKTELKRLNNLAIIAYYEERTSYTADSYDAFKDAVNAYGNYLSVNEIINDPNVSQTEVNQWETLIRDALDLLVEQVDPSPLLAEYEALNEMDLSGYTPSSKAIFTAELDRLFEIITGDNLDRDTFNYVDLALDDAPELLIEIADVSQLSDLLDDIDDIRRERYSHASYGLLMEAVRDASQIIENQNRTEEAVQTIIVRLHERIDGLMPRIDTLYIRAADPPLNIDSYVVTGDAQIESYYSTNDEAFTVDENGNIIPKAFGEGRVYVALSNDVVEIIPIVVKANVKTPTIVLMAVLPVFAVISGVAVVTMNKKRWTSIGKTLKRLFSKKKEG